MTFGTYSLRSVSGGVKSWPGKLINMLCCLFASLTHLQNETFSYLKHGYFNCICCYFQTPSVVHCMNATVSAQSPNFNEIFTHKQFLPTSAGNAQAQLHFCEKRASAVALSG